MEDKFSDEEKHVLERRVKELEEESADLCLALERTVDAYEASSGLDVTGVLGRDLAARVEEAKMTRGERGKDLSSRGRRGEEGNEEYPQALTSSSSDAIKASKQLQRDLSRAQAENIDLSSKVTKLEGILLDLEQQLEAANQHCEDLEAALEQAEGNEARVGAGAGAEVDAEAAAPATAAAGALKYAKLKERYKALEESSQEEIDELAAQLTDAQEQISLLEAELDSLKKKGGGLGGSSIGGKGGVVSELQLKEDNERIVAQLVSKQVELAQLSENDMMLRRDLSRAKEVTVKLSARVAELEGKVKPGRRR